MKRNVDAGGFDVLKIQRLLPGANCGRCGESSCIKFALKIYSRLAKPEDCLLLAPAKKKLLAGLLSPHVMEVSFGMADKRLILGGENVTYRHQQRFYNQPVFLLGVSDTMSAETIKSRVGYARDFSLERMGVVLRLDGISIRNDSNDLDKFIDAVNLVRRIFKGSLMLCSDSPEIMRSCLGKMPGEKPLIYAATRGNHAAMTKLAVEYGCPLVVSSGNIRELMALTGRISKKTKNIVLDPKVNAGSLREGTGKLTLLREMAVSGNRNAGYPLMAFVDDGGFDGALTSCILVNRFASLIILDSDVETEFLLPNLILKSDLYSDPNIRPSVEPCLYGVGTPDENSPVLLTSNFRATFHSLIDDLKKSKTSCHIIALDTGGLAVSVAVAADRLNAELVKNALDKSGIKNKINHRKIIIPGYAAKIAQDIEKNSDWKVIVGPQDSSEIGEFLGKTWKQ